MNAPIEPPRFLQLPWGASAQTVMDALGERSFSGLRQRSVEGLPGVIVEGRGAWLDWNVRLVCAIDRSGAGNGLEQVQAVFDVPDGHVITALDIHHQVMNRMLRKYERYTWDYTSLLKDAGHLEEQRCYRWCHHEQTGGGDMLLTLMEGTASRPPIVALTYRSPTFATRQTTFATADEVADMAMLHVRRAIPPQAVLTVLRESGEWYCFGISDVVIDDPEALADVVVDLAMRGVHFGIRHSRQTADLLQAGCYPLRPEEQVDWSDSDGDPGH